ncbi:cell division protein FtsH [Candidatus Gottesmanbacteria bacterium RIFCSPLOWO2_02_FULL_42_29]|uniref:ATP-dependent zinc metalloprotease FtsH n=1 Tax=Candidatus Gottesmanbacteria bacterium RIFCSPLOWO2_01_FULL_42_22 TaxID=1798391 RepID=A0A1F6BAV6_9BACT|nr:MAG: cell division protein FtsH [Candidatus Gottesmanbacteria bacterium RIFCSPHIGHO2_01_FULL_42_27]OGG33817.1 MAG: cell division protein FtsH [Candidatus Gottesmanbacteria bacterium RIFCSPLOWO2_12_FULL_42_10]OGG34055.1 MAG: cell division protein FtsH [Candidatus Gottesmanbacteria bacterium RIFCSPLOWO2_01_FULL_42_22]OGG36614.1 MAG: cell division protein FtsH [Candidatus Gottesmanbacteria bacterium RIFCSPLOWO2_02_FULL_42_29]
MFEFKLNLTPKNFFLWSIILLIIFFIFFSARDISNLFPEKTLTNLIGDIKSNRVKKIEVIGDKLLATYNDGKVYTSIKESQDSLYTILSDAQVDSAKVDIEIKDTSGGTVWFNILSNVLPLLLMVGFFLFLIRQARGAQDSIFSFGQSRAKLFSKDNPRVTFKDVAGVDEAKQELSEVVDFLKNPQKYRALGARTPKGALLVGPSGTGKTLLARALAGEAGVPFFSMAGSEFMEMLVGVGASRVRDLFNTAKKNSPSIIFIDEIDAIGRVRSMGTMGGHDEREQTLNQILVEMDGFTPNEHVIVVAATNRGDLLDTALLRPGRFDRRVVLDLPDLEGRKSILKIHVQGKPVESNIDWEKVSKRTVGFSGADLENMLNEAAILAARKNQKTITFVDIEEAATKVKLGPEKKRLQSDLDRKMTAYHEAGHAIVSYALPHMDPVHRISIVSRGMALGFTLIPPARDRIHETKTHMVEQITAMMGGRAAEQLIFTEMTSGAANDIDKATALARDMVIEYGMSELGPINFGPTLDVMEWGGRYVNETKISPQMQSQIDNEIKKILDASYKNAASILKRLKTKLDAVARELLKRETLESEEFEKIVGPRPALAIS